MMNINSKQFKEMLKSGSNNLVNHYKNIDALNVFPVPDGDTGTNMSMTFTSGVNDALKIESDDVNAIAKTLSKGLLMGARGNSGVILSQIFRGFYQGLEENTELNSKVLTNAFENGSKVAYKAVMRPVEGTILTVIRESSASMREYYDNNNDIDVIQLMEKFVEFASISLENTPNLLPVLKEVGVVDSGGAGLLTILEGFLSYLKGNPIELLEQTEDVSTSNVANTDHDEFGYCTEFIIKLSDQYINTFEENKLRNSLEKLGNSLVVVQDEDIVKVHVHTLTPGDALNIGQRYGEFVKLKIENMQEQHNHLDNSHSTKTTETKLDETKEFGMIAVCAGDKLKDLFMEFRCDKIISGGQTMNPSTEDFIEAIKEVNAKNIFVFPNNSNIILAANQAASIIEDKNIVVIESKTIPEGLRACVMFNPEDTLENNIAEMKEAITLVNTGQVTYAIKDTTFEGIKIQKGDYMAMYQKNIINANVDRFKIYDSLLNAMIKKEDAEIITVIKGEDGSNEDLEYIVKYIEDNSELEVEVIDGGQPVYSFILGVE